MHEMSKKKCTPCAANAAPLKGDALLLMKRELDQGWNIIDEHHLEKEYRLKNFQEALNLTCAIGRVAEEEGHHPEITLTWEK